MRCDLFALAFAAVCVAAPAIAGCKSTTSPLPPGTTARNAPPAESPPAPADPRPAAESRRRQAPEPAPSRDNLQPAVADAGGATAGPGAGGAMSTDLEILAEFDQLLKKWNDAYNRAADEERKSVESVLREKVRRQRTLLEANLAGFQIEARVVSAAALGFGGDAGSIPPLLQALNDSSYGVRSNAAVSLALIAHRETPIEPLIRVLSDPNPDVRGSAAFALSRILRQGEGREAVPALIARLEDPSFTVRNEAVRALAVTASRDAVPAILEKTLKDEYFLVRLNSAIALAAIRDSRSVEPLIGLLSDPESQVRKVALYALEQITGQREGNDAAAWSGWWARHKDEFGSGTLPNRNLVPPADPFAPPGRAPAAAPDAPPAAGPGRSPTAPRPVEEESTDVREQPR
ncbi:MAG: HEAT repeat domain-containing protein [Planctomycetes bacterium]|nr:HEAT repeat domain-containing protein [Planctomycetota bacterium]